MTAVRFKSSIAATANATTKAPTSEVELQTAILEKRTELATVEEKLKRNHANQEKAKVLEDDDLLNDLKEAEERYVGQISRINTDINKLRNLGLDTYMDKAAEFFRSMAQKEELKSAKGTVKRLVLFLYDDGKVTYRSSSFTPGKDDTESIVPELSLSAVGAPDVKEPELANAE